LTLSFCSYLCKAKSDSDAEKEEEEDNDLSSVDIGDKLPSLVLKNEKGEDIQVADLTAENGVVLFLVPKADTRT
jgi:peroxiredoxin Q/BCP